MTHPTRSLALALLLTLGACKAGPSAFDRSGGGQGPMDTADAASLPSIPDAPAVEGSDSAVMEGGAPEAPTGETPTTLGGPASGSGATAASPDASGGSAPADSATLPPPPVQEPESAPGEPPRFERPEFVRGIYLNAWAAGSRKRVGQLLELARRTEVNAFVIDIKDATGYVSHPTKVSLAKEIGATEEVRIRDLPGLLHRLHDEGIYPIARIVIVKDPLLSAAHPDWAVQTKAGGVFKDGKGIVWMNPYNHHLWEYEVALAREVVEMGFPEIQWDYVRFPDIPAAERDSVAYPGDSIPKPDAIRGFLAYSRDQLSPLGARVTADVFGVTASASRDVGIGQVWESLIGAVDVALPMVYPSHYWQGSFGYETPNAYPYEIVHRALSDALRRSGTVDGAGATRPWLQDFSLGKPRYGAPEVRAQIQAAYDAGIHEWVLWNPGSHYTEAALEPAEGWSQEPEIRVADRVVPVSLREAVLDSVRVAEAAADSARAAERVAADSARAQRAASDSARSGSAPVGDSASGASPRPAADTTGTLSRGGPPT